MIESPVLQNFLAKRVCRNILDILQIRFGSVPTETRDALERIIDDETLRELNALAVRCSDLEAFRAGLPD